MELVYLYIKQYRSFCNTELNFSQEVDVHYDADERSLTGKRKKNILPNDFWGENINSLTMLVGNNGAGKTSLMQYIISLFQGLFGDKKLPNDWILVLREDEKLYYCENLNNDIRIQCSEAFMPEKLTPSEICGIFSASKLIYLTNALSFDDVKRCQQEYYGRNNYLYDCSIGGLISSDARIDVNGEARKRREDFSELETYFLYEQYKQIKFVFDKNQYQILQDMKDEQYPVPLPQKLYMELLTDSQLDDFFKDNGISDKIKENCFSKWENFIIKVHMFIFLKSDSDLEMVYKSRLLQYLFCRSCLWGMLRSIVRRMNVEQQQAFKEKLEQWLEEEGKRKREFCEVSDKLWEICEQIVFSNSLSPDSEWNEFVDKCKPCYNIFFRYIESEANLAEHFKIETSVQEFFDNIDEGRSIHLSVSTTENPEWFIDFLKKYRYAANPDYFLNFQWGLSSGENNLLSTFASLYYIFGADYTNGRNGDYTIYNEWEGQYTKCDNIILLADEVDLTYHPEWQREYISLLTAFLVRVYPPTCCKNIQIILSTHSPILLGDIPQQNVIYLKKDLNKHDTKADDSVQLGTFGQNIHLLLQHSFFLENGTMGRFAHNKINGIFRELAKLESDVDKALDEGTAEKQIGQFEKSLEMYRQYIDLIAEPIIKRKLISQIEQIHDKLPQKETVRFLSDESLEEQLRLLQAEKDRRSVDR